MTKYEGCNVKLFMADRDENLIMVHVDVCVCMVVVNNKFMENKCIQLKHERLNKREAMLD